MLSQLKKGSSLEISPDFDSNSAMVVAEREALAKIMNVIDSNLERKRAIIDALEQFHSMGNVDLSKNDDFTCHYLWLHENLRTTEQALESALVHQQILYSKLYAGTSMVPNTKQSLVNSCHPTFHSSKKNDFIIKKNAKEIANEMITRMSEQISDVIDAKNPRHSYMSKRISTATSVMLINNLLRNNQPLLRSNVSESITDEVTLLSSTRIPDLPPELIDISHARDAALNDLKDALKMLESELHQ